jgi:hypothetical protein
MNLEQFIETIKEDEVQHFIQLFRFRTESLKRLMKFFNTEIDGDTDFNNAQGPINSLSGQDFRNFPLCHCFRRLGTAAERELNRTKHQFLIFLKLFFFFKIDVKESEVKNYLLRADYESRNNQPILD